MRITMPQLGESVVEGTIGKWFKKEGETVQEYEPLLEVITDKVSADYPSPITGKIVKILVPEGQTVPVGTEIAEVEVISEKEPEATAASTRSEPDESAQQQDTLTVHLTRDKGKPHRYSPAVRRLAEEYKLDLSKIKGSGLGGRVTKKDVESYINTLESVKTHEPEGAKVAAYKPQEIAPKPLHMLPGDEIIPLTHMRRAIADHMVQSVYTAPHVTAVIEVDMTSIVQYRESIKDAFQKHEGIPITYLPFVVSAVAQSLREHPILNSSWSDEGIVLHKQINIGIAVALEDGLLVPVIKQADEKNIVGLARTIYELSNKARAGKLSPEDVQGGTFTVNNPGTFGTIISTPIIVQPQAAILTMEAIIKRPVVINDAIAIRSMMYMCLSFDHRILDGLQAARFLQSVKKKLETFDPDKSGVGYR